MVKESSTTRGIWTGIALLAALTAALLLPDSPDAARLDEPAIGLATAGIPISDDRRPTSDVSLQAFKSRGAKGTLRELITPNSRAPRARGLDTGMNAIRLAAAGLPKEARGGWMRVRGVDLAKIEETRAAFREIRAQGLLTCVMLRLPVKDWIRKYLPEDLREPYENGRKLGAAFGDLVDAWEVDNEPDIGFVPELAERYTAFLKASWLGLKRGIEENAQRARLLGARSAPLSVTGYKLSGSDPNNQQPITDNRGVAAPNNQQPITNNPNEPMVLMGSLGLPPGRWLERFAANDGFAYTDGFNYHYYGYADDFTGVYRQHETAVAELSGARDAQLLVKGYELGGSDPNNQERITNNRGGAAPPHFRQKNLPIFLTEIGYGMLGKSDRHTKEGRLRQWRWFKSVGEQTDALGIEGPMGFYIPPYLEYGANEFGLTVPAVPSGAAELSVKSYELGGSIPPNKERLTPNSTPPNTELLTPNLSPPNPAEGGPNNRGAAASWTAGGITYQASDFTEADEIRRQTSDIPASILLSKNWGPAPGCEHATTARRPTSEASLQAVKSRGATGTLREPRTNNPTGRSPPNSQPITHNRAKGGPPADWRSLIGTTVGGNELTPAGAWWIGAPRDGLPLASERNGQSAKSEGLYVPYASRTANRPQPTAHRWSVSTPPTSLVVLDFLPGTGLSAIKRYNGHFVTAKEPAGSPSAVRRPSSDISPPPSAPAGSPPSRAEEFNFLIRTANGNLFQVYPTRQATSTWQQYLEPHDNFTSLFYGRAALPWRFKDNKPASFVVVMYPKQLPTVFEFRRPQLLRLGEPGARSAPLLVKSYELLGSASGNQESSASKSTPPNRHGVGRILLYNFSDQPVTGRLLLPDCMQPLSATNNSELITAESLTLSARERREISVSITVPFGRYERFPAEIEFVFDEPLLVKGYELLGSATLNREHLTHNAGIVSRFRTDFLPGTAGMKATVVASLLQSTNRPPSTVNRAFVASRPRATEEAPMTEVPARDAQLLGARSAQLSVRSYELGGSDPNNQERITNNRGAAATQWPVFVQQGAQVEQTAAGFTVTITAPPPGKVSRTEVEIPWPDGLEFPEDAFVSLEYRLKE